MKKNILILDDHSELFRHLCAELDSEGYAVKYLSNWEQFEKPTAAFSFQLIIVHQRILTSFKKLMSSLELSDQPLYLVVSEVYDELEAASALHSGAQDYISKPIRIKEFLARVYRVLRWSSLQIHTRDDLPSDIKFNTAERKFYYRGLGVSLHDRELKILDYLLTNKGVVVSRESIIGALGAGNAIYDRTIDSHISRLRTSLKSGGVDIITIRSVYGRGYLLEISSDIKFK